MSRKTVRKNIFRLLIAIVVLMNVVAAFHAYKFTHYDPSISRKTSKPDQISFAEKIKTLAFGVNNPRPANTFFPSRSFETVKIQSNKNVEGWLMKTDSSKGTIIIFHGYGGNKSSMLDKAEVFLKLGYNALVLDFMGSGASEGNQTTIGFYEALQVKESFDYIKQQGEKNIFLFGTSMGAAAIMKAQKDYSLSVKGVLVECPFGTMLKTVKARFDILKVPSFPMAHLLVFWGGLENNFNAFRHNPQEYAKYISCPTLLMFGEKDMDVSRKEIDEIYKNLKGPKKLCTYPLAGHENYLKKYKVKWTDDVSLFMKERDTTN
ncbi:alpha/beta hydrolase [Sphingobacteriaceae bacterium]|nr:alpha/beta hydrolase [Sphingobacteriaceae bacterium]